MLIVTSKELVSIDDCLSDFLSLFQEKMDVLMRKAQMGDWFVIFLLSKNLDSILFKEFIVQLADKLKTDA